MILLETTRFYVRPFTLDDLPRLIELRTVPEVNKYIGGDKMQNPQTLAVRIRHYRACQEKMGFSIAAMIWKETGELFGWSGLQPLDGTDEVEVGYGMAEKFWRKGIGYECALAWLRLGFEKFGLQRIVAVAYPANIGSWGIMEKLGMSFEKLEVHYGAECKFYAISAEDFFAKHGKSL